MNREQELESALAEIVDWFDELQSRQRRLLQEGQSLASASANWDAATLPKPLDTTRARKLLGR